MDISILNPRYFSLNCKFITPNMTYEHYLVEVINGSMFLRNKCHHLEQYNLSNGQSHGENDVVSSQYCMDFKLLVDQEAMNAMSKNKPEVNYSKMSQGFIFVKTKQSPIQIPSNNILLDLMAVKSKDIRLGKVSDTVKSLLKNLKKDKNLFFYYPYEFSSKSDLPPTLFERILNASLSTLMQYRASEQPERDSYVCIKANSWFLIYEWVKNSFMYRDKVHEILCGNYIDAKLYSVY
ncbi:MAG: hypothetical protein WBI55_03100 [Eubacteriales bacterium]